MNYTFLGCLYEATGSCFGYIAGLFVKSGQFELAGAFAALAAFFSVTGALWMVKKGYLE